MAPPKFLIPNNSLMALRMKQVRGAYEARDFVKTIVEAEELLDTDCDNIEALMFLGSASLELTDGLGAEAAFSRCLELQPEDKESHLGLGLALYELTDFQTAKGCFETVLTDNPDCAEALYFLGMSEMFLGELPKAKVFLSQAEELAPEAFPLLEMPTSEQFEALIEEAVGLIESVELRDWIGSIPFGLFDVPPVETLRSSLPPLSPHNISLIVGDDSGGSHGMAVTKPDCIEIYRLNLMRIGISGGSVTEQLAAALASQAEEWRQDMEPGIQD